MSSQKYSVNQQLVESLLAWVKSGEIAIPEILIDGQLENFNEFLSQRRQMMSKLIERYYRRL